MGENVIFNGEKLIEELVGQSEQSFTYVFETYRTEYFKRFLIENGRDFDELDESLGTTYNIHWICPVSVILFYCSRRFGQPFSFGK